MTIDIDAILDRANAATPGPWKYVDTEDGLFGVEMDAGHNVLWDMEGICDKCFGNMRFIAASRQDVPALCEYARAADARAERAEAALDRARALLAEQAEIITANVWHIPPEYSARNIVLDAAAKMRDLAALLAAAPEGK